MDSLYQQRVYGSICRELVGISNRLLAMAECLLRCGGAVGVGQLGKLSTLGEKAIAAEKLPRARDIDDIYFFPDFGGEGGERSGKLYDTHCGIIENLVPR